MVNISGLLLISFYILSLSLFLIYALPWSSNTLSMTCSSTALFMYDWLLPSFPHHSPSVILLPSLILLSLGQFSVECDLIVMYFICIQHISLYFWYSNLILVFLYFFRPSKPFYKSFYILLQIQRLILLIVNVWLNVFV